MTNIKRIDLTLENVSEFISYNPDTGIFVWKKAPSRRHKVGSQAGALKSIRGGEVPTYWYITLHGVSTPAARVAWLLQTGSWPETNMLFKDGDTTNIKFDNLRLANYPSIKSMKDGRRVYKMPKEQQRHYGLKRYYGMTGEEYGQKLADQKGLCAICGNPETAMLNGVPKVMHVDHDHATGAIRDLLCGMCNGMLGLAKDNPQVLIAAAEYLQRHSASNVVPLKPEVEVA